MANIVFVCSGNTCRSPMAAALAARRLAAAGSKATVSSAGVNAVSGRVASHHATVVMGEMGLSLAAHRSRRVTGFDLYHADVVLTMEEWQLTRLVELDPFPVARVCTLAVFTGGYGDVSDPYGGDLETYRRCAMELDNLVDKAVSLYLAGPDFPPLGRE